MELSQIDLVIVATITPDMAFPSTACLLQHKLGLGKVACFDIEAACSGFLYALDVADGMLASGRYKCALVIGAEKMSSILDWEDRSTCVLFGDGAGAAVLSVNAEGPATYSAFALELMDPTQVCCNSLLEDPCDPSSSTLENREHYLKMNGKEIFKSAVRVMEKATRELLAAHGFSTNDVAHVIPHQANVRIVESMANRLEIPLESFTAISIDTATPPLLLYPSLWMKLTKKHFSKKEI